MINLQPLVIAAYTNEIDAVAHLGFFSRSQAQLSQGKQGKRCPVGLADELIRRHGLRTGSRRLTVNTFQRLAEAPHAADLIPGPQARGVYGNFSPHIAELGSSTWARSRSPRRKPRKTSGSGADTSQMSGAGI